MITKIIDKFSAFYAIFTPADHNPGKYKEQIIVLNKAGGTSRVDKKKYLTCVLEELCNGSSHTCAGDVILVPATDISRSHTILAERYGEGKCHLGTGKMSTAEGVIHVTDTTEQNYILDHRLGYLDSKVTPVLEIKELRIGDA